MKRTLLLLTTILAVVTMGFGQDFDKILQAFDEVLDTNAVSYNAGQLYLEHNEHNDPDSGYVRLTWVDSPKIQGEKAMRMEYSVHNSESWGGYQKLGFSLEDSTMAYDFSGYDTLQFSYYVEEATSLPGRISFRVNLTDCAESEDGTLASSNGSCEYYYSLNPIIADAEPGWNTQKIAIENNVGNWDGSQFNLTTWAGVVGNQVIDKDKIKSIDFELSISGSGSGDRSHGVIILDDMRLTGAAAIDVTFFNGRALPANVTLNAGWGGGSTEITTEEDAYPEGGTTSIKYNTPPVENTWALWDGPVFSLSKPANTQITWITDSLKFKIKADAGLGGLKIVLADDDTDGDGPDLGYESFYMLEEAEVGYDGTWKDVRISLQDFDRNGGAWDAAISASRYDEIMDTTRLKDLKILIASTDALGKVLYLDDVVIGNPVFDLFPPASPAGVSAIPYTTEYYNLVMWTDVEGETGEVYDVYASVLPIDSLTAPTVEKLATNVLEGTQVVSHRLQYPLEDGQIDYYYAVVCKDAAGNEGEPGFSDKVTGTAQGIPTVSLDVPANFVADGYFDEWYDSGIRPFKIKPETNNVVTGEMADSTDLNATVWIAIDDDYLYVAADVIDDVFFHAEGQDWWTCDALDFFIGLYRMVGGYHRSYNSTTQPDHKMQFRANGFTDEMTSGYTMEVGSENYYFEGFDPDYVFEAKISLDAILKSGETRFHPVEGMKIPMDIYFHDNDSKGTTHESAIAWGPNNKDTAWQNPYEWSYTFIGTTYDPTNVAIDDFTEEVATSFRLEQNYPNPFNPTTTINYTLGNASLVKISVYNMLGEKVADLVDRNQQAGSYKVQWNAANMATGMYFYRLQAGDFVQTRKMLLLK